MLLILLFTVIAFFYLIHLTSNSNRPSSFPKSLIGHSIQRTGIIPQCLGTAQQRSGMETSGTLLPQRFEGSSRGTFVQESHGKRQRGSLAPIFSSTMLLILLFTVIAFFYLIHLTSNSNRPSSFPKSLIGHSIQRTGIIPQCLGTAQQRSGMETSGTLLPQRFEGSSRGTFVQESHGKRQRGSCTHPTISIG